jgi:hypothetical protein
MKSTSAPIALIGYNRPHHIERCISSLQANSAARGSTLYVFLDGPRGAEDASSVEEVRRIARATTRFREVRIAERKSNLGLSRNVIDGVTSVLAEHESVIVVEDDLVVSPSFLQYMNEALVRYRFAAGVFSVSGYNYPRRVLPMPAGYPYDAFFVTRHMCWGWGTWKDRWQKADWEIPDHSSLTKNSSWKRSLAEAGLDLPRMLEDQVQGRLDSWAIRWTYAHFANHAVCLVPVESFVNNMGADGSGVHMKASTRYFHASLNRTLLMILPPHVYVDPWIARKFKTAERRSLAVRIWRRLFRAQRHIFNTVRTIAAGAGGQPHPRARAAHDRIAGHSRTKDRQASMQT